MFKQVPNLLARGSDPTLAIVKRAARVRDAGRPARGVRKITTCTRPAPDPRVHNTNILKRVFPFTGSHCTPHHRCTGPKKHWVCMFDKHLSLLNQAHHNSTERTKHPPNWKRKNPKTACVPQTGNATKHACTSLRTQLSESPQLFDTRFLINVFGLVRI